MAELSEMAEFLARLPGEARAVLVVQCKTQQNVFRTKDLNLGTVNGIDLDASKFPNWPKAVWEGLAMAIGGMPDPETSPASPQSQGGGEGARP